MVGVLVDLVTNFTNFEVLGSLISKNVMTDLLLILFCFLFAEILGIKFRNNSGLAIRNDKSIIMLDQASIIR